MHKTVISPAAIEMSGRIRGERAPWTLAPKTTAHVAIGLQTAFVAPGGVSELPMNREIMPNVNQLSAAVRETGALNVFIRFTFDAGWTAFYDRHDPARLAAFRQAFAPGDEQHQLWPAMDIEAGDLIVDKTRLSAMIPCDLDAELKARGIDTLIVTGCVSNCCCESTVRDAAQMNYRILFVADGDAAFDDAARNGAVEDIFGVFACDIVSTDEAIDWLRAAVPALASA